MIKIHLILHSHIDPIWLWHWQAGLDMVLCTWRTACDILERHPDLTFTCDGGWAHEMVERTDRALFERIREHVAAGRWQIIGGWWVQPDCNLPLGESFRKQIELGRAYFTDRFNEFPRIGFNPDSFGHTAALPGIMHAEGQNRYIMMRPDAREMTLPARLFRWRGEADGPEVLTFRIAGEYQARPPLADRLDHFRTSLTALPEDVNHTMCFIGVGDHGGGLTEQMIQWCRDHQDAIDGARLAFSSPKQFFEAIAAETDMEQLPLVVGELQQHAVGCYSVYRPIKTEVRRAEQLLHQAEVMLDHDPRPEADTARRLREAWRRVCYHQFHDTLGGTCIASSYTMVHAQLGEALATADEVLHFGLRRRMNELEDNSKQRLVAFNASRQVFDDFVEFEPWREYAISVPRLRLLNAAGDMVPHQRLDAEPLTPFTLRLLVPMRQMQPQELRELRIDLEPPADVNKPISGFGSVGFEVSQIHNDRGAAVNLDGSGKIDLPGLPMRLPLPRLHLIEDPTDTWSHGIDRYADAPAEQPTWEPAEVIERGPLRATLLQRGRIGRSSLRAFWRVYGDSGFIELLLEVDWHERNKVLKWVVVPATSIVRRFEGIPEGQLSRTGDGRELPLRDRTLLELAGGHRLGVVCPDVFALDGTGSRLRLTLLRSALFAHHQPHTGVGLSAQVADAGLHRFRFRLAAGADLTGQQLDEQAWALQRPPALAELTRGMPPGVNQGVYNDPIRPPIDPD